MKKVVVTGAGGYIGRHVIKKLCDAGYDTYAVDLHKKDWDERAKFCNVKIFPEIRIFMKNWDGRTSSSIWHGGMDLFIIHRLI